MDDKAHGWAHPPPRDQGPVDTAAPGPLPSLVEVAYREQPGDPWRYGQIERSRAGRTVVRWNDDLSQTSVLDDEQAGRLVRKPFGAPSRLQR